MMLCCSLIAGSCTNSKSKLIQSTHLTNIKSNRTNWITNSSLRLIMAAFINSFFLCSSYNFWVKKIKQNSFLFSIIVRANNKRIDVETVIFITFSPITRFPESKCIWYFPNLFVILSSLLIFIFTIFSTTNIIFIILTGVNIDLSEAL